MDAFVKRQVDQLGISIPLNNNSTNRNSIAVNSRGDLAILSDEKIYFINTRYQEDYEEVSLIKYDCDGLITNISYNIDGTSLLLWGEHFAAVMHISYTNSDNIPSGDRIQIEPIATHILGAFPDSSIICRASWHPYSSCHVILLFSTGQPLLVVNVASDDPPQEYPLVGKLVGWLVS